MRRPATFAFKNFFRVSITLLTFASLGFSQPTVTVSPKSDRPTTTVLVSGNGFPLMRRLTFTSIPRTRP